MLVLIQLQINMYTQEQLVAKLFGISDNTCYFFSSLIDNFYHHHAFYKQYKDRRSWFDRYLFH